MRPVHLTTSGVMRELRRCLMRPVHLTTSGVMRELNRLGAELVDHLDSYRDAKARFAARTAVHQLRHGAGVEADFAAASDPHRQAAAADAQWYATEIQATSAAIVGLATLLQVQPANITPASARAEAGVAPAHTNEDAC